MLSIARLILFLTLIITAQSFDKKIKRSIHITASHQLISESRLPANVRPTLYKVYIQPNITGETFCGSIKIFLNWHDDSKKIFLHAHYDLVINEATMQLTKFSTSEKQNLTENIEILRIERVPKKNIYAINLKTTLKKGSEAILELEYEGFITKKTEGLFKGTYTDTDSGEEHSYIATNLKPHNARRLFPCFDEPSYKVLFDVSIARPPNYITLFNTPLIKTDVIVKNTNEYVVDYFETTPPMSSFAFGFLTSKLKSCNNKSKRENTTSPHIRLWAHSHKNCNVDVNLNKLLKVTSFLEDYFNKTIPLPKIDVLVIPNIPIFRLTVSWGIILFRESDFLKTGFYGFAQELIYQWIGCWITPYWWNDAHLNKAIASFLAADIAIKLDNGEEFSGKYPMTVLYSLYYEFSKRYPHSRITAMKQETISSKMELILRMFNFTFGDHTLKSSIRQFVTDYTCKTFVADDFWNELTQQSINNGVLSNNYSVAIIARSWMVNDRLPVVNVQRNYERKTAYVTQKLYLRERPHDVPEQEKMLWWIPLTVVQQNKLNFLKFASPIWMENSRNISLSKLPAKDEFIIVNPEEIGPFPVNYDLTNWNLLSNFLQTLEGRRIIPTYTRAKLLHDAWNIAYAGDLSFATAFNMTLFMKYEMDHIVWSPVFTFIDQIGRHIGKTSAHTKFESYVIVLLKPLYEGLGLFNETEENWKTDLRSLAKHFLCRAGFINCVEGARQTFINWINSTDYKSLNPIPHQEICPVFKWGTFTEWEFGFNRLINFPRDQLKSDRTFLLKMLAGCPVNQIKITHLLNSAVLEENDHFSDNDINLIFNTLSGTSSGYTTLFFFLKNNWSKITQRFENKTNLWDTLIGSATGFFTTEDGYFLVKKLHEEKAGAFGSAEHIVEKSLRHIKEEYNWSKENIPIIEKWLDDFLSTVKDIDKIKYILD